MNRLKNWSRWSITTKILVPFLALSVISIAVMAYVAIYNMNQLGNHALETSTSLGESAIEDSTTYLNRLGEEIIIQKAHDVAKQVDMYLADRPAMTVAEMRNDAELRRIVVQPVGTTGYTTLIDPNNAVIIIHKFPEQEKDISTLADELPTFWDLIETTADGRDAAGYYNWLEVDGSIQEKYAGISAVNTTDGRVLTLWATTYIDEFSQPAEETKQDIYTAIADSSLYISNQAAVIQSFFIVFFVVLVILVTIIALLLSRAITRPILSLTQGAREIGQGRLDYILKVRNQDELGALAESFNKMRGDLQRYVDELQNTATENIAKERTIQENLRLYAQKISQAQERERKRIARELHDETVQDLIVVTRHLEDLALGKGTLSADDIREEVRQITAKIRRFSQELRISILEDLGLVPAVKSLAADFTENYGIPVQIEVNGEPRKLADEAELMLFRIIQEALSNVRKHSEATEALVLINFTGEQTKVNIRDNGRGFEIPSSISDLASTGNLGLVGIQERTQLLGGTFDIYSQPGQGTNLTIIIPG